jgi:hypothetical protein
MTIHQSTEREQLERSLIEIAVESWRFARLFGRMVSKLDAGEGSRYVNQLRYFQKKLEDSLEVSGMKIVNVEGQPFDPDQMTCSWSTRWWSRSSWGRRVYASKAR